MDLRYLQTIIAISEEKSITRAAEHLFVTQSALSQQLKTVEEELGTPLFIRSRSDWKLTRAGEIYVEMARAIGHLEHNALKQIAEAVDTLDKHMTVGLIPERGVNMFTAIYPAFHQQYPHMTVDPVECNVKNMQKRITDGEIDLGLITLREHQKDDNLYYHMLDEELLLAVPASDPLAAEGSTSPSTAPETGLSRFADRDFIRISRESTMREYEDLLFEQAGFTPHSLFSTASNISKRRMVRAGMGCSLMPYTFTRTTGGIIYFRLQGHPSWEVTMCSRRGSYLTAAERCFLQLCRTYWQQLRPI